MRGITGLGKCRGSWMSPEVSPMRPIVLVVSAVAVTLSALGCGGSGGDDKSTAVAPAPAPTVTPNPTPVPAEPTLPPFRAIADLAREHARSNPDSPALRHGERAMKMARCARRSF